MPGSQTLPAMRVGHASGPAHSGDQVQAEQPIRCFQREAGVAKPPPLPGQRSWAGEESTSLNYQHFRKEKTLREKQWAGAWVLSPPFVAGGQRACQGFCPSFSLRMGHESQRVVKVLQKVCSLGGPPAPLTGPGRCHWEKSGSCSCFETKGIAHIPHTWSQAFPVVVSVGGRKSGWTVGGRSPSSLSQHPSLTFQVQVEVWPPRGRRGRCSPALAARNPWHGRGARAAALLSCGLQTVLFLRVQNRAEGVFLLALGESLGGAVWISMHTGSLWTWRFPPCPQHVRR